MIRRISIPRRRGEGHVEYIIITSLIMVCALVAFFSMINNIKVIAEDLKICSDCPDGVTDPDKTKTTQDLDAEKTNAPSTESSQDSPPPAYPNWLADMMAWFSGAKWFWDYQATPSSSEERFA